MVGHIAGAVVETLAVVRILEEAVTEINEMDQFISPLRRYLHISISIYYPGHSNCTDEALVDEVHNNIAANPR